MTSLLRRKPRITAARTARPGRHFKLALLLALGAAPAVAQYAPRPGNAQVANPLNVQTQGGTTAQRQPAARPAARVADPAPAAVPLPSASAGKVMYFQKPADSVIPVSGQGGGNPVAALGEDVLPIPRYQPDVPASTSTGPSNSTPLGQPRPVSPAVPLPLRPLPMYTDPIIAPPLPPSIVSPAPMMPIVQPETPSRNSDSPTEVPLNAKDTMLPSREQIFIMYDDASLERGVMRRIRQDLRDQAIKQKQPIPIEADAKTLQFPPLPSIVPAGTVYQPKTSQYEARRVTYEPLYVVHRRLHFEEKNAERYGWDLGFVQPLVSTFYFYKDVLLWPNSLASGCVHGFWDSSAGKCLPGSPTPYYLYPPGLTLTGSAFEGVIIAGTAFLIP